MSDHRDLIFGSWAVCDSHSTADVSDRCRVSSVTSIRRLLILIYSIDTRMKETRRENQQIPFDVINVEGDEQQLCSVHAQAHTQARAHTHTRSSLAAGTAEPLG